MKKFLCIIVVLGVIVAKTVSSNTYEAETEKGRIKCISQYGWKVSEKVEEAVISIPKPLNLVYIRYNEIQKRAGFDISEYEGKKVCRYTYKVLNHSHKGDVYANIFVCDGKMIAADIMSRDIGGFMHEINRKEFIK